MPQGDQPIEGDDGSRVVKKRRRPQRWATMPELYVTPDERRKLDQTVPETVSIEQLDKLLTHISRML